MSAGPFDQTNPASRASGVPDQDASTKDVAKDEAASVASDAKAGTQQVAETAKGEAQQVAQEAQQQVKDLFSQVMSELKSQTADQKGRASGGLRTLADDLGGMAQHSDSGFGGDLARQAADRTRGVADWLENRDPAEVLDEVKRFARRKPGAFLAGAAVLGLLGGRLTRGVVAEKQDESSTGGTSTGGTTTYDASYQRSQGYVDTDAAGQPLTSGYQPPVAPSTTTPSARPMPGQQSTRPGGEYSS